jgi:hypothetical protein
MKIKSELYMQELNLILFGLHLQLEDCIKILKREKRKAQLATFLSPWLAREIWTTLAIKGDALMKHVNSISELREKIMQAEGIDENMQSITFQEICKKNEQD